MKKSENQEYEISAAERFWNAIEESFKNWRKKKNGDSMDFYSGQKDEFCKLFIGYYNIIKRQFMTLSTKGLDSHKQAAIMVISALESNIISQPQETGKVSLGAQAVILDTALSYLERNMNNKLKEIGARPVKLILPIAFACETAYFDIMRRILYYEHQGINSHYEMRFNIIEWADRFFLLEYIALLNNGIDPQLIRDKYRDFIKN